MARIKLLSPQRSRNGWDQVTVTPEIWTWLESSYCNPGDLDMAGIKLLSPQRSRHGLNQVTVITEIYMAGINFCHPRDSDMAGIK